MTKSIYFLGILILISSCRKEVIRDVTTFDDLGNIKCTNGVFDDDEMGEDCGGAACEPCVQIFPACQINDNKITIVLNSLLQTKTFLENKTEEIDPQTGSYTFTAYTDGTDYLQIIFDSKPDISKTYKDHEVNGTDKIVSITYYSNSNLDMHFHGELFVNYENDQYTFSSCEADFYPWFGSSFSVTQSFSVTF